MSTTPTIQTVAERINQAVGEYIKADPAERTITRVAGDINVHPDTLVRYMNGTGKRGPSYRDVVAIARITGKPVDWFVGEAIAP